MVKFFLIFLMFPIYTEGQNITTVAGGGTTLGDGGAATAASIGYIASTVLDANSNLYIADGNHNRIRKVNSLTGLISTIAGNGTAGYSGDGGLAIDAELNSPGFITIDRIGNIYISDAPNRRVRKIDTFGIITTYAGNGIMGFSGDGGPATSAELTTPQGLVFDALGNLYITDLGAERIRKVSADGNISTVAGNGTSGFSGDGGLAIDAELGSPEDVAVDAYNNLYIADYNNNRIRKVDFSTGIINTIAGDSSGGYIGDSMLATSSELDGPFGVAFDSYNNLYISDFVNNRIRKVDTSGIIYTVAGNGTAGFTGDGGLAILAEIKRPEGVAFDPCGNLYIADNQNERVREVRYPPSTINLTDTIVASTSDNVCTSTSVTYTAAATTSSGTISYQWYVDGSVVSIAGNTYTYSPANGDSIRCEVTAANSCTSAMMSSNTINMVVTPVTVPTITVTAPPSALAGSVVTVDATVTGAGSSYSINWYDNSVLFSTTTVPVTTYVQDTGTDVITATVIPTGETCSDTANSNAVSVSVGNEEAPSISPQGGGLSVFPNPVGDVLNIVGQDIAKVTVSNVLGQVVFTTPFPRLKTGVLRVVMAPFASGVYVVEVTDGDGVRRVVKVVKE